MHHQGQRQSPEVIRINSQPALRVRARASECAASCPGRGSRRTRSTAARSRPALDVRLTQPAAEGRGASKPSMRCAWAGSVPLKSLLLSIFSGKTSLSRTRHFRWSVARTNTQQTLKPLGFQSAKGLISRGSLQRKQKTPSNKKPSTEPTTQKTKNAPENKPSQDPPARHTTRRSHYHQKNSETMKQAAVSPRLTQARA